MNVTQYQLDYFIHGLAYIINN